MIIRRTKIHSSFRAKRPFFILHFYFSFHNLSFFHENQLSLQPIYKEKIMEIKISQNDNIIIASLIGRLDTVAAQNCEKDFKPIFDNADKSITLVLDKLDYVSSSGLRVLLNLRKEVAAKGGTLVLKNLTEEVKSVFVMTGFTKIFTVE